MLKKFMTPEYWQSWAEHPKGKYIRQRTIESIPFWIAAAITGGVATGYAALFTTIERLSLRIFHDHPYWLFGITPVMFGLSWLSVRELSPTAVGSGIPQLMAALSMDADKDDSWLDRLLGFKMMAVKFVSSMFAALGGGIVGREGPTIQISGAIFHEVWKRYPNKARISHASMLIAGAAAGLAAAFNTPLGGIVYVVEELSKVHLAQFRSPVLHAVLVAGLMAQWLSGPYLYLGFPTLVSPPASFLAICILVGAVSGGFGALYAKSLLAAGKWARHRSIWQAAAIAVVMGLLFAGLVNLLGENLLGSGKHVLLNLLFRDGGADWKEAMGRLAGGIMTYTIGGAGGIFAPSLAAGAMIGSLFQSFLSYDAPHLLVLVGMVGFLTGVTQTPFTSFVLVLEMTDRHSSIFYLMIAAVAAHSVSKLISHESFYEIASKNFQVPANIQIVPEKPK
jgi:H+/Cl- antiporter ClcA